MFVDAVVRCVGALVLFWQLISLVLVLCGFGCCFWLVVVFAIACWCVFVLLWLVWGWYSLFCWLFMMFHGFMIWFRLGLFCFELRICVDGWFDSLLFASGCLLVVTLLVVAILACCCGCFRQCCCIFGGYFVDVRLLIAGGYVGLVWWWLINSVGFVDSLLMLCLYGYCDF